MPIQNINNQIPAPPSVGNGDVASGVPATAPTNTGPAPGTGATPTVQQNAAGQPNQAQLKRALASINSAMLQANRTLQFSVDEHHKPIVKVVDSQTGDVVTQIPSKVAIAIAQSINVSQNGFLINNKA